MHDRRKKSNFVRLSIVVGILMGTSFSLCWGQDAACVGSQVCADCHEELSTQFTHSVHSRLASWDLNGQVTGCESCHGPGSLHADSGDKEKIFRFDDAGSMERDRQCLSCHVAGVGLYWPHAEHGLNGVTCTDCHEIHQSRPALPTVAGLIPRTELAGATQITPPRRASLKKEESLLCMECHQDVGARMMLPSRHPVREGKMECSSCHEVHGSEAGMLDTVERMNNLCVGCHTSKQGPFVFEHPPVAENCATCHTPHGSVADNLLRQNEPFVCLQCHEAHFHIGRSGISTPIDRPTGTVSNSFGEAGWRVAFGTKCSQCHQSLHGSDLPSQSVTSQGKSLTR